ncbi:MAG: hypothetical protein JXB24_08525 [Bacteroidales bacterium]|nr:hypothetical protein [Bacteroidales bacterium]
MKTNIYCISLILISLHLISINSWAQEDTTCVVNGFVYEVEETNPLEDGTVRWYHYDTLGILMNYDSIYTSGI